MTLQPYEYHASESFLDYEFFSAGPKGKIRKVVRFTLVNVASFSYYNLGFGDWNEKEKRIDDFVISNNHDTEKVLMTVAATALNFTDHYPDAVVYAQGTTISRTRLYQMGISRYLEQLHFDFEVFGLIEEEGFERFERGKNYTAFAVRRKKL